jgi:20S proteasome subunit alpha 6
MRGGPGGGGGMGMGMGMARGRGGMLNAPRGPAGMRSRDKENFSRSRRGDTPSRDKRDRRRDNEREVKTTMTDFRIVGIEMKELGWSWGLVGEAANVKEEKVDAEEVEKPEGAETETPRADKGETASGDKVAPSEEVKNEADIKTEEASEEKVGGKRKAQSPDGGE